MGLTDVSRYGTVKGMEDIKLSDRAKALDRQIEEAGGLAAHWKQTAPEAYTRLVDPVTGDVIAERPSALAELRYIVESHRGPERSAS